MFLCCKSWCYVHIALCTFISWNHTVCGAIFGSLTLHYACQIWLCSVWGSKMEVNCGENKDCFLLLLFFVMNFHFVVHTAITDLVCSFICEKAQCNVMSSQLVLLGKLPSTHPPPAFFNFIFIIMFFDSKGELVLIDYTGTCRLIFIDSLRIHLVKLCYEVMYVFTFHLVISSSRNIF